MAAQPNPPWPFDEPGVIDLGDQHFLRWYGKGKGFLLHHPTCDRWVSMFLETDRHLFGHRLLAGGPDNAAELTISDIIVCPMGCGDSGFIRHGQWMRP